MAEEYDYDCTSCCRLADEKDDLKEQITEANEIICNPDLTYQNDDSVKKYQKQYIK